MTATLPTACRETLLSLEPALHAEIRGQSHVTPRVVSVLQRGQLGLSKPGRPHGSFLFLGPTGVGKTGLTQAFTLHLFGPEKLRNFDMSEFQTQESLGLPLGAKLGEAGFLGEAVARTSEGTILLDEVEKESLFRGRVASTTSFHRARGHFAAWAVAKLLKTGTPTLCLIVQFRTEPQGPSSAAIQRRRAVQKRQQYTQELSVQNEGACRMPRR